MFTMIQAAGLRRTLFREVPALALSLVAAELLFRFHSFTLECLAFLATWFVLSGAAAWAGRATEKRPADDSAPG